MTASYTGLYAVYSHHAAVLPARIMSGHSKWATIKRKKGEADAKRGKVFTKLVREITTAARLGGGDANANPRLRAAVAAAKASRMPADNIERGIKKGIGALEGPPVEDCVYEGYGPGGVALLISAQTDNKNRTSSEVRAALSKNGGNLGTSGSTAWMFKQRGMIHLDAKVGEDRAMELALGAGADDVRLEEDRLIIECDPKAFSAVLDQLDQAQLSPEAAEISMVAENTVKVAGEDGARLLKLIDKLDELDDVQKVDANFDMDEAEYERLSQAT